MGNYSLKKVILKAINNYFIKFILFNLKKGPPFCFYNYIDPTINKV